MVSSILSFDIIGNAASAAHAFDDTAEHAELAADAVGHLRDNELEADAAGKGGGGGESGGLFSLLAGGAGPGIAGISPMVAAITAGIGVLIAMLPAIAAVGAGLGVLAGGFAILMSTNKAFASDIDKVLSGIKTTVAAAATVLVKPFEQAFSEIGQFVTAIGPLLTRTFSAAAPLIQPLVSGLLNLIGEVLPGLITMLQAAKPAFDAFSQLLSGLGGSLGKMLDDFAKAMGPSAQVLEGFGKVVNALLPFIGQLAIILASALGPAFQALGQAIARLLPALDPLLQILGKFGGAVLTDLVGLLEPVASLLIDLAPSFTTLAKVSGQLFTTLENAGVFAVLADALEEIARPLATLINALVNDLAPILPVVISGFASVASVLSGGIAGAVADLAEGLTAIVRAAPALVPLLLGIWAAVKLWTLAQAALDIVLDANPIGLVVLAIAALIAIVVEVVKHWHDFSAAAEAAWGIVEGAAISAWNAVDSGAIQPIEHGLQDVVGVFQRLPGDILKALGNLGSLLLGAGRDIIDGLLSGINAATGGLLSRVEGIAHDVSSAFGSILRILSPSQVFAEHGRNIVAGLVQGITGASGSAVAAVRSLGSAVAAAGAPGGGAFATAGAGGGGTGITLQLLGGDGPLTSAIMEAIRAEVHAVGGGAANSVQRTFGQVA